MKPAPKEVTPPVTQTLFPSLPQQKPQTEALPEKKSFLQIVPTSTISSPVQTPQSPPQLLKNEQQIPPPVPYSEQWPQSPSLLPMNTEPIAKSFTRDSRLIQQEEPVLPPRYMPQFIPAVK
jgi:hypothetical protein